jgi:CubicO group peptidase (beta-lactamase class C family)
MREYHVPGVALGVLRDGKTTIRGFGVTSVEDPLPVTADTIFPLASISKTVTAMAVMRLVEQGSSICARRCARTCRFPRAGRGREPRRDAVAPAHAHERLGRAAERGGARRRDAPALRRGLSTNMQLAPPGAAWSYNNAGFGVAGRVIEMVTGKPFGEAVADLVFTPLGLSLAVHPRRRHRHAPLRARPSRRRRRRVTVVRPFTLGSTLPAGGVAMSMTDLLAYARFHLGDGTNAGGTRVVSPRDARPDADAAAPQAGLRRRHGDRMAPADGWRCPHGGARRHVRRPHPAARARAREELRDRDPHQRGTGWRLIQDVERAALQAYHGAAFRTNQAISHRGLNETLPLVTPLAQQPEVAAYVGRYVRPMNDVVVRVENGALIAQVRPTRGDPSPDMPLAFYGPDRAVVTAGRKRTRRSSSSGTRPPRCGGSASPVESRAGPSSDARLTPSRYSVAEAAPCVTPATT